MTKLTLTTVAPPKREALPWSEKQKAIFSLVANGTGNIAIEACAGGAKTTTIVEAMNYLPEGKSAIFVAFNKSIADTLQSKIPASATASTLHSVASKAMRQLGWSKVNGRKTSNILQYELIQQDDPEQVDWFYSNYRNICSCISIAKGSLSTLTEAELKEMVLEAGVEDSYYLDSYLYPLYLKSLSFKAGEKGSCVIDFDDMLRIPFIEGCAFPMYDYVFVDEAQDLNEVQRLICKKLLLPTGRLVAVGDRKQAIYGFRGADYDSFDRIKQDFSCTSMPLDISYRCSKAVIAEANLLYEDIYARDGAKDGSVCILGDVYLTDRVEAGDMVLCRTNFPLVMQAMSCMAHGKPVCVLGSDLPAMIEKHAKSCIRWGKHNYNKLTDSLHADLVNRYFNFLCMDEKLSRRKEAALLDLRDALHVLLNPGFTTLEELRSRMEEMFVGDMSVDTSKYILFSSIHKAKGLEARNVFILEPCNLPHPFAEKVHELQQEKNLHYVAITRAKENLIYVVPNGEEMFPLSFDYTGGFNPIGGKRYPIYEKKER